MSDPATETPTETAPTEDADVKMEVEATEKTTTTTEPEKATCTTETMSEEPATETPKEAAPKETDADVKMEVEATEKATTTTEPEKAACTTETKEVLVKPAETEAPSWDNTNRKIVVHNVMKFMNPKHVERLSQSLLEGLQQDFPEATFAKVKKPPKDNWVQITLHKDEWVQPLIDQINSGRMTNKKGGVLYATRVDNNKGDKRGRDDGDAENGNKRQRTSDDDDKPRPPRDPRDVVTPFWKTPYEEQLKAKTKQMVQQSCMKIVKEIKGRFRLIQREAKRNPNRDMVKEYNWIKCKRPIELEEIIIPPGLERNKSEFTFGYRCPSELAETEKDQQIPAVGFMASGWAGGVSRPHVCQNIPSEACGIVDMVDAFLATSVIPPYDSKTHRGFWRYLTIRTSRRTGQCMVVIVHAPPKGGAGAKDESDDLSGVFESEKQRLIAILTEKVLKCERPREFGTDELLKFPFKPDSHEEMPISVTSLFFQEYEGLSNPKPEHPVQVRAGYAMLVAYICCLPLLANPRLTFVHSSLSLGLL
jgi:tRNA (uracil-5-)-methyltransferase